MATASEFLAKAEAKKGNVKGQKKIDRSSSATRPWNHNSENSPKVLVKSSIKKLEVDFQDSHDSTASENQKASDNNLKSNKQNAPEVEEQEKERGNTEFKPVQLLLTDSFYVKVFQMFAEKEINARQMKIISVIILIQGSSPDLIPISNSDWQSLLKTKHIKWIQNEIKKLVDEKIIIKVSGQAGLTKSIYGLNHKNLMAD